MVHLTTYCWITQYRGHTVSSLNLPYDPQRDCKQGLFGGILFTPIPYTAEVCYATGSLKVRVSLWGWNGPPSTTKPLQQPWLICQRVATAHLYQMTNTVPGTAHLCLSLALESTVDWISTLAYSMSTNYCPERVSVACCTHSSDKTNVQKSETSTKIEVYSYRIDHRRVSCSAGVLCRGCWAVTCNMSHQSTENILGTLE